MIGSGLSSTGFSLYAFLARTKSDVNARLGYRHAGPVHARARTVYAPRLTPDSARLWSGWNRWKLDRNRLSLKDETLLFESTRKQPGAVHRQRHDPPDSPDASATLGAVGRGVRWRDARECSMRRAHDSTWTTTDSRDVMWSRAARSTRGVCASTVAATRSDETTRTSHDPAEVVDGGSEEDADGAHA